MTNEKYDAIMECAENNKKELQAELKQAVSELQMAVSEIQCKMVSGKGDHVSISTDMIHKHVQSIDAVKAKLSALDEVLKIKESIESGKKKLYWYTYRLRGFSVGCQPKDFATHDDSIGRLGAVSYERKLTEKEMEDYELDFLKEDDAPIE